MWCCRGNDCECNYGFCPHFYSVPLSLQVAAATPRQTLSLRWLTTRRILVTAGRCPSPPRPAHPLTSSSHLKINPQATSLHHWGRYGLNATKTVATAGPARPLKMTPSSPGTIGNSRGCCLSCLYMKQNGQQDYRSQRFQVAQSSLTYLNVAVVCDIVVGVYRDCLLLCFVVDQPQQWSRALLQVLQ